MRESKTHGSNKRDLTGGQPRQRGARLRGPFVLPLDELAPKIDTNYCYLGSADDQRASLPSTTRFVLSCRRIKHYGIVRFGPSGEQLGFVNANNTARFRTGCVHPGPIFYMDACGSAMESALPQRLASSHDQQHKQENGFRVMGWRDGSATSRNPRPLCMWLGRPPAALPLWAVKRRPFRSTNLLTSLPLTRLSDGQLLRSPTFIKTVSGTGLP